MPDDDKAKKGPKFIGINFIRSLFFCNLLQNHFCTPLMLCLTWSRCRQLAIWHVSSPKRFSQTIISKMTSMTMKWLSMMKKKERIFHGWIFSDLEQEVLLSSRRHSIIWHSTIEHYSVVASDNFKDFAMAVLSCCCQPSAMASCQSRHDDDVPAKMCGWE